MTLQMNRVWAMPSADTLTIKPIRGLVKKYLHNAAVSVDPFARNCRWATYTNDLNPDTAADYHLEAADFLQMLLDQGVQADVVIFDPPYSVTQVKEVYSSIGIDKIPKRIASAWTLERDLIKQLLKIGGRCLSFGWNSQGMGKVRGFETEQILLVAHGREHNDTICTVERKREPHPNLFV
jgi:hypothetical protein